MLLVSVPYQSASWNATSSGGGAAGGRDGAGPPRSRMLSARDGARWDRRERTAPDVVHIAQNCSSMQQRESAVRVGGVHESALGACTNVSHRASRAWPSVWQSSSNSSWSRLGSSGECSRAQNGGTGVWAAGPVARRVGARVERRRVTKPDVSGAERVELLRAVPMVAVGRRVVVMPVWVWESWK